MNFTRASITIIGGIVLSGCGTVLPAPEESLPERSSEPTEPTPSTGVATSSEPPSTLDLAGTGITVDAGGGSDAGPKKAVGEDCASSAECQSGECFLGGKTHYCTVKCPTPDEEEEPVCEALGDPFTGACNKEGFCKR